MKKNKQETSGKWERKEILMAVLIGVLVFTAGMQTLQLAGMANSAVTVPTNTVSAPAVASGGAAPSVPTNLQNLPSMVGGC